MVDFEGQPARVEENYGEKGIFFALYLFIIFKLFFNHGYESSCKIKMSTW